MRSGGFPCRVDGCTVKFAVADSSSLQSLMNASSTRTAHELEAHGYRHPAPPVDTRRTAPYVVRARSKDS
jgi:hypothetical protein